MRALRACVAVAVVVVAFIAVAAVVARADPPDASAAPPPIGTDVREKRLDNGLTVIVEEDHRTPLVSMLLRYDVGERVAPDGMHGLAKLTQVMEESASAHVTEEESTRLLFRAGATASESTDRDETTYKVTLPASRMALPLWLWSDRMGFLRESFDDALFASKRAEVAEEMRARLEGTPLGKMDVFAGAELFPEGHPYHEELGTPESVAKLTRADVLAFHDKWMTPDHAVLAIVGDVTAADAFAEVERWFSPIPASNDKASVPEPAVPRLDGDTRVRIKARIPNAIVDVRWPTPRLLADDDAALDVLAETLAGRHRAHLYWALVSEQKVAIAVWAHQRSRDLASEFEMTIEGAPGKTPDELLTAVDAAMASIRGSLAGTPDADIAHAAAAETVRRTYAFESIEDRAFEYAKYAILEGAPAYFLNDLDRYRTVTGQTLDDVASHVLPADRRVVLLITPAADAKGGGERIDVKTIPAPPAPASSGSP